MWLFSLQAFHSNHYTLLSYARFAPQTVISAHCKLQPHYTCCTQSASKTKGDTEHAGRTRKIWFAVTWELNKQWWKMGTTTQQYSKWAGGAAAKMKNLHHHEAPLNQSLHPLNCNTSEQRNARYFKDCPPSLLDLVSCAKQNILALLH